MISVVRGRYKMIISLVILTILYACGISDDTAFEKYKMRYRKIYHPTTRYNQRFENTLVFSTQRIFDPSEEEHRATIFDYNIHMIKNHNERNTTWKLGINYLSDLSFSDRRKILGTRIEFLANNDYYMLQNSTLISSKMLMNSTNIDWREKGVITPIKNQGMCGSCWAFSAIEGIESHYVIARRKQKPYTELVELSVQHVLDCTFISDGGGCYNGYESSAYRTVMKNGASSEWTYPYMSFFGDEYKCNITRIQPIVRISNFNVIPSNNYSAMVDALLKIGPIAVVVDASEWFSYESGIFDGCDKNYVDINHSVQLVGMGTEGKLEYWIVRNSWGTEWGEQGYIRLLKNNNFTCGERDGIKICGTCGILYQGTYPIIN
jgi:cathepsin L